MSAYYYVKGVIPASADWKLLVETYNLCKKAGVPPPKELLNKLSMEEWDDPPDPAGRLVDIKWKEADDGNDACWEVDLDTLPPLVRKVRFVVSY